MPNGVLITLDAAHLSEQDLIDRTQSIAAKMALTANATLIVGLPYTPTQFQDKADAYKVARQAVIDSKTAAAALTQTKHTTEIDLERATMSIVRTLEARPTLTAADVLALGLSPRAPGSPAVIAAPTNLSATYGDVSGAISLHWDPLEDAVSSVVQFRVANSNAPWQNSDPFTGSNYQLTGLTPGELYEVRVCGIFPRQTQPGPACNTIEHRAA